MRDLLFGIVLLFTGVIFLSFRNRVSPRAGTKGYFTKEQIKNKKIIAGFAFIIMGIMAIINYFFR